MKIYLGLGTNIGDRITNLDNAKIYLNKHLKITVIKESKIYETSPMEKKRLRCAHFHQKMRWTA